jgi:hypothetical protein
MEQAMKDDLAEELLGKIMGWEGPDLAIYGPALQALADYKYDEYGTFRPGEHFLESLARWLWQFATIEERRTAFDFVMQRLVFISDAEMEHAIELVYRDIVRPLVRAQVATARDLAPHLVRRLTNDPLFKSFQRRLLILGLSDGARLDRLRRASPELSHEQFALVSTPAEEEVRGMRRKLEKAIAELELPGEAKFNHVLLIDDFTGSGFTMIREEGERFGGKLVKVKKHLDELAAKGLLDANPGVTVITYVASEAAERWIVDHFRRAGIPWTFRTIQRIPDSARVVDPAMEALCKNYYDAALEDEHKGNATFGYKDCRLPLVLTHNTPNNSICLLWIDTSEMPGTLRRHALFPRYERHSANRP